MFPTYSNLIQGHYLNKWREFKLKVMVLRAGIKTLQSKSTVEIPNFMVPTTVT